jgi:hypothetical protein
MDDAVGVQRCIKMHPTNGMIALLEDDAERIARFRAVVGTLRPATDVLVWRSAHAMIRDVRQHLNHTTCIALDHDLIPESASDPDPGDGRDVARYLATLAPVCPVIIHSTNYEGAMSMKQILEDAGWTVQRVVPFGDDWIERDWREAVQTRIAGSDDEDGGS